MRASDDQSHGWAGGTVERLPDSWTPFVGAATKCAQNRRPKLDMTGRTQALWERSQNPALGSLLAGSNYPKDNQERSKDPQKYD